MRYGAHDGGTGLPKTPQPTKIYPPGVAASIIMRAVSGMMRTRPLSIPAFATMGSRCPL
ncbi:hypothetical protein GCM10027431_18420 [Lysobacter rhizosphaerae]